MAANFSRPVLVKLITQMAAQKKFSFLEPGIMDASMSGDFCGRLFSRFKVMNPNRFTSCKYHGQCNFYDIIDSRFYEGNQIDLRKVFSGNASDVIFVGS